MIGLALLLISTCGYGFEVLDTTDEEWVAHGYKVIEEAVIDPLDYGEPYTNDGTPTVGVHLSFVESDSSEAWRVVFVLDRKVVVLREGEEPVEIPVDLEIESCAFSPSGRYVVVHDGVIDVTNHNAARIDLEAEEVRLFDSHPILHQGIPDLEQANDGSIRIGSRLYDPSSLELAAEVNTIPGRLCWPGISPLGSYLAIGSNSGSWLYMLDREGDVVWERETGTSVAAQMAYSPDERYIAVPLQTGLEVWDVATGETIWRDESGEALCTDVVFIDGNSMVYSSFGAIIRIKDLDGQAIRTSNTVDATSRFSITPYAAASSEEMTVAFLQAGAVPRLTRHWAVLDSELMPIWISSSNYSIDSQRLGTNGIHLRPAAAISNDGARFIHTAVGMVRVVSIRSAR